MCTARGVLNAVGQATNSQPKPLDPDLRQAFDQANRNTNGRGMAANPVQMQQQAQIRQEQQRRDEMRAANEALAKQREAEQARLAEAQRQAQAKQQELQAQQARQQELARQQQAEQQRQMEIARQQQAQQLAEAQRIQQEEIARARAEQERQVAAQRLAAGAVSTSQRVLSSRPQGGGPTAAVSGGTDMGPSKRRRNPYRGNDLLIGSSGAGPGAGLNIGG